MKTEKKEKIVRLIVDCELLDFTWDVLCQLFQVLLAASPGMMSLYYFYIWKEWNIIVIEYETFVCAGLGLLLASTAVFLLFSRTYIQ